MGAAYKSGSQAEMRDGRGLPLLLSSAPRRRPYIYWARALRSRQRRFSFSFSRFFSGLGTWGVLCGGRRESASMDHGDGWLVVALLVAAADGPRSYRLASLGVCRSRQASSTSPPLLCSLADRIRLPLGSSCSYIK
jgi:hypothetical protein